MKILLAIGLILCGACLVGCSIPLAGSGRISIGFENRNLLVLEHEADGDKQENTSNASLNLSKALWAYLFPGGEPAEPAPVTIMNFEGEAPVEPVVD